MNMDNQKLIEANRALDQKSGFWSKNKLWMVIGIVTGVGLVVAVVLYYYLSSTSGSNSPFGWPGTENGETYPYIPAPKNTVRSTSFPELLMNVMQDANESAVDYSVISRQDVVRK